jgi:glyceraldehyde-3-phosphate dehydrogenase (ferredoxin)
MIKQIALEIDAKEGAFKEVEITGEKIIGPVDYGFEMNKKGDYFCFGAGLFAGSALPGTNRLIFCGMSPLWENFYISTMGGAATVFFNLGINYIAIKNARKDYSILRLRRKQGKMEVSFEKVDVEKIWAGYNDKTGFYALQDYIFEKWGKDYDKCRILATGPAALKTNMGAIGSAPVQRGEVTYVDCWAGRGGLGSKLLQDHRIVGMIYGGDYEKPKSSTPDIDFNKHFEEEFGKNMIQQTMEATTKYRYDPKFETGGTFGVNFARLKDLLLSFNYSSIYLTNEERLQIHDKFIAAHYLKQFNEETIVSKQFKTCGDKCGAVCKKMRGKYKKDYEPYQTMGPNSGIFDQRAAEKLNHYADSMGFDAIQIGGNISWIMELLAKKVIKKEDLGLTKEPKFDYKNFDVVQDSMHNAELGIEILDMMVSDEYGPLFKDGIRESARQLDKKFQKNTKDYAVYNALGEKGCMVPNQYWVPGMFSPMPIMGKYFSYYDFDFMEPVALGKKNAERMIKELYVDNTGMCRFHRGWGEKLIEKFVNEIYNVNIDYNEHHRRLAAEINENNPSVFWETERVIDLMKTYVMKAQKDCAKNDKLDQMAEDFKKDKVKAAKEYWDGIKEGVEEGLKA